MLRVLYSLILYLSVPLMIVRLYYRGIRAPGYRHRILERFGHFTPPADFDRQKTTIWIHAVSVGETYAAQPLVKALQQSYPDSQFLITSMTPTGSESVKTLFDGSVFHAYLPYDLPMAIRRFLHTTNPDLLIIMETELWPNLIYHCKQRDMKILLANARLSEKSALGYEKISGLMYKMLQSFDAIAAQSKEDADRLEALGADIEELQVTGSLKFHVQKNAGLTADEPFFDAIKASNRIVITAASTREGEEEKVLEAYKDVQSKNPNVLLLLVPRHPERFDEVTGLCERSQLQTMRRSLPQSAINDIEIIVGDSMGEMARYYSVANIAFVGGSLVNTGCQNVIEPAVLALPILVGPSQFNFAQICNQLESAGGMLTVSDEEGLAASLNRLVENEALRRHMGAASKSVVEANQQALPALLHIIDKLIS